MLFVCVDSMLNEHPFEWDAICRLRHIFVDERRSADRVPGPEDTQAAMVMGNTTRKWTQSYDLRFKKREFQAGVNAMQSWRAALLKWNDDEEVIHVTDDEVICLSD